MRQRAILTIGIHLESRKTEGLRKHAREPRKFRGARKNMLPQFVGVNTTFVPGTDPAIMSMA